jgi:transposase
MRQKSTTPETPSERLVRDIRRATRKQHSAEEKIRIVLDGLRGEVTIAELCRREGIAESSTTAGRKSSSKPASGVWPATRPDRQPPARSKTSSARPWS